MLAQPPRGVCLLLRKGNPPLVQLDLKCPWRPQVHRLPHCWTIALILNPADTDSALTGNEAAEITSDEIMYNPFDRPPGEEVVEVIPRDRSRSPSRS